MNLIINLTPRLTLYLFLLFVQSIIRSGTLVLPLILSSRKILNTAILQCNRPPPPPRPHSSPHHHPQPHLDSKENQDPLLPHHFDRLRTNVDVQIQLQKKWFKTTQ